MTDRPGSTSDATPPPASTPLALVHRMVSRFAGNAIILAWTPLALLDAAVLNAARVREHPMLYALPVASLLSGVVLRYFADRAPRVGAALFLAAGGTGVAIGMLINGLMAANSIAAAVLVVWAALFFGPRGLTFAIASYLAIAATEVALVLRAPTVLPAPLAPNMRDPVTWMRLSIWGACGLAIVGIIVLQVIRIYRDAAENEAQARRDLEAQNAALRAARTESEALQRRELVSGLAAGVAHDLANVVQAITANAEILDEHVANGEGRHALDDIRAVGERARVMVRRLLEVGRSRGPTIAPVGATEFLARLAPLVTPLLEGRIQYLPTATAQRRLLIDAPRLEHALLNLAVNARDAMPTGGTLAITISDAPDSGRVIIAVTDTGSGIPADLHERIFDPFFTTKDATSGSGLGLAMVRRIVAEAGGTLTLQSRVDEGTTFSLSLPATA